jgi:hypothetical protein
MGKTYFYYVLLVIYLLLLSYNCIVERKNVSEKTSSKIYYKNWVLLHIFLHLLNMMLKNSLQLIQCIHIVHGMSRGGNRMLVGFMTTYAISTYHQPNYVFESGSGEVYFIQHYKFDSGLRKVGGFFPGTPVSSTNKTDRHEITEILCMHYSMYILVIIVMSFKEVSFIIW